jgi:XTP/dITP diphosphohydrolase
MTPLRLFLASSNPGKLNEYRELAGNSPVQLQLIPNFNQFPAFDETAPTFAENSAGKALHYSRFTPELVIADDSGLVVPALGGSPGVHSARYAGPGASDADRVQKLLREMRGKEGDERRARFICVITIARNGSALAITSDFAEGALTLEPKGKNGFGYDPIFFSPVLGCTFAETSRGEKNHYSHRGKAFRKVLEYSDGLTLSPDYSIQGM